MLTTTCSLGVAPSASRGARLSSRRGAFASREAASLARTRQSREVVRAPGVARAMADDDESLLRKLNPFKAIKKQQEKAAIEKRREEANKVISDDVRKQLFGDGLMGKMAAGLINNAAGALKEQFNAAAEASEVTYDAAVRAVRNDTRVRRALGDDVQATPPMSRCPTPHLSTESPSRPPLSASSSKMHARVSRRRRRRRALRERTALFAWTWR